MKDNFLTLLKDSLDKSEKPKPQVIADVVIDSVISGMLKKGDVLPSINKTARFCKIACETVRKAYGTLKEKGLIGAHQGKSFFVLKSTYDKKRNVFLLFNFLSTPYKAAIARGIIDVVGDKATLNFASHNRSERNFTTLLENAIGKYEYYAVIPMRSEQTSKLLSSIDQKKLLLIDLDVDFPNKACSRIIQNFDTNFLKAMEKLAPDLEKYKGFDFRFVNNPYHAHPQETVAMFREFCKKNGFNCYVDDEVLPANIHRNTLWFLVQDSDLVHLIKMSQSEGLKLKRDYGIITYNDMAMKHIIEGGVSTISIDFYDMGRQVGKQILDWNCDLNKTVETYLIRGNTI